MAETSILSIFVEGKPEGYGCHHDLHGIRVFSHLGIFLGRLLSLKLKGMVDMKSLNSPGEHPTDPGNPCF